MAATGNNPLYAYYEILRGAFEWPSLLDTLAWAVPLTGMTIVAALPLRGGMLNLGGDGQVVLGGLGAAMVALYLPAPGPVRLVASRQPRCYRRRLRGLRGLGSSAFCACRC